MPAQDIFENVISTKQMKNWPINVADVKRYFNIYGPNVATQQGKTTKRNSDAGESNHPCELPPFIFKHHRNMTLCVDIFYVQGIPLFPSISTKLHFRTATQLANRSKPLLLEQFQTNCANIQCQGGDSIFPFKRRWRVQMSSKRYSSHPTRCCLRRWPCRCCRTFDLHRQRWLSYTYSGPAFPTHSSFNGRLDRSFRNQK